MERRRDLQTVNMAVPVAVMVTRLVGVLSLAAQAVQDAIAPMLALQPTPAAFPFMLGVVVTRRQKPAALQILQLTVSFPAAAVGRLILA
jgi:hypothetical protein